MKKSNLINTILQSQTIVEYLASQSHEPFREYGGRYKYLCPLHDEKSPSFYVFTDKEFQYYHCYGCKGHGDLINLYAGVNGYTLKEAIGRLATGLNISQNIIEEQLALDIEDYGKMPLSVEEMAFKLSASFHTYIEDTNYDPVEVQFMEKVFQKVDNIIVAMDFDTLRELYETILDTGLPARHAAYSARKFQEEKKKFEVLNALKPRLQQVV